jgi:serine protease Do
MNRLLLISSILVCGAVVGAAASPEIMPLLAQTGDAAQREFPAQVEAAADLSGAFQYVAAQIKPSVVSISSEQRIATAQQFGSSPGLPDEFEQFFGDDFMNRFFEFEIPQSEWHTNGIGTGVIISEDGYIVTNNHVVSGGDNITVTLHDQQQFEATVVGADAQTDLAVLKIDAADLTPATLGDSTAMQIGEWVLAIGSPFGLDQTVTAGIVSATGRNGMGIADYEDFIQTDAAINPGNSGGPLVNLHGEVIGINTAIVSRSGSFAGVGFATPSHIVQRVADSLIEHGHVDRGLFGVVIQELTSDLAASFGYEGDGILVADVQEGSPAEKAGVSPGDIITSFNGSPMNSVQAMRNRVADTEPGSTVPVELFRDGQPMTLNVTIGKLESTVSVAGHVELDDWGLSVRDLDGKLRQELGYENDVRGAVVVEVRRGTPAHFAGLEAGDVILSLNGSSIESAGRFEQLLADADIERGLRLQVLNGAMQRFVVLKVSPR